MRDEKTREYFKNYQLINAEALAAYRSEYKLKNRIILKEKRLTKRRERHEYYLKNREKLLEYQKKYNLLPASEYRILSFMDDIDLTKPLNEKTYEKMVTNREVVRKYQKTYYAEHEEHMKAYSKKYRSENREKLRAAHRKWKAAHPESGKKWADKNRTKVRETWNSWHEKRKASEYPVKHEPRTNYLPQEPLINFDKFKFKYDG
jgi:hypothetical protein